jgi:hypothetical protein
LHGGYLITKLGALGRFGLLKNCVQ